MRKLFFIFLFVLLLIPFSVSAKEINAYLFYGDTCPHCAALEKYLDKEHSADIKLYKYEVYSHPDNVTKWEKVQEVMDIEAMGVPYFIVGDKVVQGYNDTEAWENKIDTAIENAKTSNYTDHAGIALGLVKDNGNKDDNGKKDDNKKEEEKPNHTLNIPLIGEVDLSKISLFGSAVLIGLVDGFNPCAMWILIFLITLLLGYENKKRMWILGITFLATSGLIYFLFMIGFLQVARIALSVKVLQVLIALFALGFGGYNIYRYIKTRNEADGCDVVDKDQRKKIMVKTKNILANDKFILVLLGIILIAGLVNLTELLCSLGLPVMFTSLLAYNDVTGFKNIFYILIYVLFFMLDDLIVFIIAMKTLQIKAISNKYTKYSHLIGGIIMFIIGLLMLIRPEWLMFNF